MELEHHHLETMRGQILQTLDRGCLELDDMERLDEERYSAHSTEQRARYVLSYLHAANAHLHAVPQLHGDMIELPQFMRLRRLQRRYGA